MRVDHTADDPSQREARAEGAGATLSKDALDVPWLLKAGTLGAVIGFVVAIFSKGGILFQ